jgi:hypothetical protein
MGTPVPEVSRFSDILETAWQARLDAARRTTQFRKLLATLSPYTQACMLPWLLLSIGTALSLLAIAVLVAMSRAERRARRAFYRSLGYSDEVIAALKSPKTPVAAQLDQVRQAPPGAAGTRPTPVGRDLPSGADGGD